MKEPEWKLQKFIIGIRHQRTFLISDIHGAMVDTILSLCKKTPFPKDCFTKIMRPDVSTIILIDNNNSISLNCNIDGIIITADMSEDSFNTIDKIKDMFSQIVNQIIPMTQEGETINRIGIVYEFQLPHFTNSAKTIFSQFIKLDLNGNPDNMLMRISLKNPAADSLSDPYKTGDYKNLILTISSERTKEEDTEEGEEEEKVEGIPSILKISADYQAYYVPPRTLKKVNIPDCLLEAKSNIETIKKKIQLSVE